MGERAAAELGVQPPQKRRVLLVSNHEYSQDRLNREIALLKVQIEGMQQECDKQRTATLVAEILLCVIAFVAGYAVGAML